MAGAETQDTAATEIVVDEYVEGAENLAIGSTKKSGMIQKIKEFICYITKKFGQNFLEPSLARLYHHLGRISFQKYRKSGNLDTLEASVKNLQRALDLTPEMSPDRVRRLQNLAVFLTHRYRRLADVKDVEAALQKMQEALDLTPEGHPERAEHLQSLATLFGYQFSRLGDLKDLEASLQMRQEAVDLTPEGHPDRARRLKILSISFKDRYRRLGDLNDLETALQKFQQAVDLTPKGHPERAEQLHSLAALFGHRFLRLGDLKDLEASLQKMQGAVDLTPEGHPDRASRLHGLAQCLGQQYQRLGDLKDLEASRQKMQEAVDLTPEGHPDRARLLQSLGISFTDRYRRLGDLNDLETALQKFQQAVDLTLEGDPERVGQLQGLATLFGTRYMRLGDLKDLEVSLQKIQEALDLTPEGHPDRARQLQSLGISFTDRYCRLGDLNDLETALQKFQQAVDLTPEGHPDRAGRLQNLAESHGRQYKRLGNLKDLEASRQKMQEAADLTPEGHPLQARRLQGLARALGQQYQRLGNLKDLEASLQKMQEAVDLTPEGHPDRARRLQSLAMSLKDRYEKLGDSEDLEAVHTCYSDSFKSSVLEPENSWKAALRWALFAETSQSSFKFCVPAYQAAFSLLSEILWMGHSIPVRHNAVLRLDIPDATSRAVQTCVNLSDLRAAIEFLEQGIATIFQQMLQLKTDVDLLPPEQAQTFLDLSSQLYIGTPADPISVVEHRKKLIHEIRNKPGFEKFLLPKSYDALCHASQGGPVVILSSHKGSCNVIIILNPISDPVHLPLPNVTPVLLTSQRDMLKDLLDRCHVRNRGQSLSSRLFGEREPISTKAPQDCFEDMLNWLWTEIVEPVYNGLKSHGIINGRLWWLPTGGFTGLPLHASPPTDEFIHSYTATLGSLLDAYAKKSSAPKLAVIGVTHTDSSGSNPLRGVEEEVEKIVSTVKQPYVQCLVGRQATVDAVKIQLQDCSWVHLACHGCQDLSQPIKSHLQLYEGTLELETILQMPLLDAQFVFLAACQTAMGDAKLVNESFHLGGGFITAGFRSAIGTMWSMYDPDGPIVAEIVYSHLFRNGQEPQANDTAEALQLAVNELKKRKVPYERWIPFIHMGI
ncbi:CHAT domain-containing protein [Mycena rebaudengoi]|nr:CHAT domain-containing protein [Mycena rebaudengoi]